MNNTTRYNICASSFVFDFSDTNKNFLKSVVCEDFKISVFQVLCHYLKYWVLYIQAILFASEKSLDYAKFMNSVVRLE